MRPDQSVAALIGRHAFIYVDEADLQRQLAEMLDVYGIRYVRELALDEHDRPDFLLVPDMAREDVGVIALEVKVAGTPKAVRRQLTRYAAHERIAALVLVTNRVRHLGLGDEIGGKPLTTVVLPWMQ